MDAEKKEEKLCFGIGCTNVALFSCIRCGLAFYCQSKCQSEHWEEHKPNCVQNNGKDFPKPYFCPQKAIEYDPPLYTQTYMNTCGEQPLDPVGDDLDFLDPTWK